MTADLTSWLRAQLDEDERVARDATLGELGEWFRGDRTAWGTGVDVWDLNVRSSTPDRGFYKLAEHLDGEAADHMARHDPARVLAEVDAKRRILDDIIPLIDGMDAQIDAEFGGGGSHPAESEQLLRLLALPYADRPGYRTEWDVAK